MAQGLISAGNAGQLAKRVQQERWNEIKDELGGAFRDARERGCSTILFSSEWLLAVFADAEFLRRFVDIARAQGAEEIGFFLVLRDPVEQFVSHYKHRAKRGTEMDIVEWGLQQYRLPMRLAGFRNSLHGVDANLVVRKFRREPGALEEMFFEQWLGVRTPRADLPETVNPSLSLSELELLRMLAKRRPGLVAPLYERLLAVDWKAKVQGRELEAYARAVAERAVAPHREEWAVWNRMLPPSEQLLVPEPVGEIPPEPREVGFSRTQMETLMGFLSESVGPRFLLQLLWSSRIRPVLGRIRRLVLPVRK